MNLLKLNNISSSDRNKNTIGSVSAKEDNIEEPKGDGDAGRTTIFLITSVIMCLWMFIAAVVHAI